MYAVGTEDMDALTFGSTILLRHLTFSEARKMPIKEFHFDRVSILNNRHFQYNQTILIQVSHSRYLYQ